MGGATCQPQRARPRAAAPPGDFFFNSCSAPLPQKTPWWINRLDPKNREQDIFQHLLPTADSYR